MIKSLRCCHTQLCRSAPIPRLPVHHSRLVRPPKCPRLNRFTSQIRHLHATPSPAASFLFKLYDIGEGITEVEIIKWQVKTGQRVEEFDPLCEVQSDKSTVELTSPKAGWVGGINFDAGDSVSVGQTLCEIRDHEGEETHEEDIAVAEDQSNEVIEDGKRGEDTSARDRPISKPIERKDTATFLSNEDIQSNQINEQLGTVDHGIPIDDESLLSSRDSAIDSAGGAQFMGEASILPSPPSPAFTTAHHHQIQASRREKNSPNVAVDREIVKASPAVRTLAARLGVDMSSLRGSGDDGRITRDDVDRAAGKSQVTNLPQSIGRERSTVPEITKVNFGRTRKAMWKGLTPQGSIPHFGYSHTLDLTPLLPYVQNTSTTSSKPAYLAGDIPAELVLDPLASSLSVKPTLLSFLVKGLLLALEEHPIMRAKVRGSDNDRHLEVRRDGIIGLAVSDPKNGLLTPSLPALPPNTSISSITSHISALRNNPNKSTPAPSITISSVGNLGESTGAMPVLPPGGGLAICAVGRAKWEVEWAMRDVGLKGSVESVQQGGLRPVLRCPVGWAGDHRVLEGAELIAFTESWKKYIEKPWRWLGKE